MQELKRIVEAILFSSDTPVNVKKLKELLPEVSEEEIKSAIEQIKSETQERAFTLEEIAGGYLFLTKKEYAPWINRFHQIKSRQRLSPAALEVLAIIAYKQPVKKSEIERIRGVSSDHIIKALLEKELIKISGRENSPGAPLLYSTTEQFMNIIGIKDVSELPKPQEISKG